MKLILYLSLSLLALLLLIPNLSEPFWNHHDWNGVWYGTIARNYVVHGLIQTKGAQVLNPSFDSPSIWGFHTHHTSVHPLLIAASYSLFGISEISSRLVPIFFTLISVILFYYLLNYLFPKQPIVNFLTLISLFLTPIFLYYSRMPTFEPLLLPFVLLSLIFHLKNKPKLLFLSLFIVILIDWPGYWVALALFFLEIFQKRRRSYLIIPILSVLLASSLILLHQYIITQNTLKDFLDIGSFRVSMQPYTTLQWYRTLFSRIKAFYGLPILLTSFFGFVYSKNKMLLLACLLIGLAHSFTFKNIVWYHDYMIYHLIPFMVISTATLFSYPKIKYVVYAIPIITLVSTYPFYKALSEMTPHQECYEYSKVLKQNSNAPFPYDHNNFDECYPFIIYYANTTPPPVSR